MKKLKLDLDNLRVETFETKDTVASERGTVRAYDSYESWCTTGPVGNDSGMAPGCALSLFTACGCDANTIPRDPTTSNVN